MNLLDVDELSIRYGDETVVAGVSLSVAHGESVGLVGESGAGKTQTALAIPGLLPRRATVTGSIRFDGAEILGVPERQLNELRARRIGFVFQDPALALNPFLRIGRQLRRIVLRHGLASAGDADARVVDMLGRVGLADPDRQARAWPHELSGGMRQRVVIAQALIAEPDLLIADEPTTALDVTVQAQVLELLETLRANTALLLITHDLGIVAGRCERMLVLEQGRVVETGPTRDVFAAPRHAHTRALIAAAPRLDRAPPPGPGAGAEVLRADGMTVHYAAERRQRLAAVEGVDFAVAEGETVAVVGESGSGKSSLVRAVLGLVPVNAGRVSFDGVEIPAELRDRSRRLRRDLTLVFQDPSASLDPQMRVERIVAEPLSVHEPQLGAQARRERVAAVLDGLGLDAAFLRRYPHQLSGGQAQRVAIARAMVLEPRVLVCDEAVAALDGTARVQILAQLRRVQEAAGLAIVFITHDLAVVRSISHRVLVMYMGRVVEAARNEDLFGRPLHPYTQGLLAAVPVPDPRAPGGRAAIPGEAPSVLHPPGGCAFHPRCLRAVARCASERPEPRIIGRTTVACHRADETRETAR